MRRWGVDILTALRGGIGPRGGQESVANITARSRFEPRALLHTHTARRSNTHLAPAFDPYTYNEGRWLDLDHERRDARKLSFNFDALLDEAIKCSPGARRVVDCEKKEGGFNRVFIIKLDNGKTVIARIPTRLAGPPKLTVSSEVATVRYGMLLRVPSR